MRTIVSQVCTLFIFGLLPNVYASNVPCTNDSFCEEILREGSECIDGYCTNPFFKDGCLKKHLPDWHKIRVCNSHDPVDAEENGYCVSSSFDYMEIREMAQNWESSYIATWILQIILNEILDVPASVESGSPMTDINFYDRTSRFDYGPTHSNLIEFSTGNEVVDCRKVTGGDSDDTYTPCANAVVEGWWIGEGYDFMEKLSSLGVMGETHWWIPKFTAARNPSLVSYLGLSGEANRRKLAETFKRPTTWKTYCDEVSLDGCASDDGVAARAPFDAFEEESMFVEGLYIGHFRATDENDCDNYNETCTGHFTDYPCYWTSYVKQQTHHLDIALKSNGIGPNNGYSYSQLTQIWAAANATKSDVIMMWWTPEITYERFVGTDAEFTRVILPPTTKKCEEARFDVKCTDTESDYYGEPEGTCEFGDVAMVKVVTSTLKQALMEPRDKPALWSPAYDTISNLELSNLHYGDIFQRWFSLGIDQWGFDLREATCSWVVDNIDLVQSFIPPTFPRKIQNEDNAKAPLYISARVSAALASLLVLLAIFAVVKKRKTKTVYYMQLDSLCMILFGLLLVSAESVLTSLNPTDAICIASPWLGNIGNVFVLVPLAMRVSAISRLATAGKHMQRVRLRKRKVLLMVGLVLLVVSSFMLVWTVIDPSEEKINYVLSEDLTRQGENIVYASPWCDSDSDVWLLASLTWQALILFPSVVMAAVASKWQDVNDTKVLGITLMTRLLFVLVHAVAVSAISDDRASDIRGYTSLLTSVDTIFTVCLYILAKLLHGSEDMENELLPDLFLHTTIMIANIEGFTAWSSVREPIQVFKFLEALYECFDEIAERHKIFKAETSGEYYVGATGVPEARSDHAIAMAKFASDCLKKMDSMSKKLEVRFGPDTSDLSLRIGMHSGPVTGGFVAGKQSRFQLFGDTMTTAKLMHESGERGRIHLSEVTANLLIQSGKNNWVEKLPRKILTEEKGELQTYWLNRYRRRGDVGSVANSEPSQSESDDGDGLDSEQRWIEWNTEVLSTLLKKVIARRQNLRSGTSSASPNGKSIDKVDMPLEEVQEIIELPRFDRDAARRLRERFNKVQLSGEVVDQLREYVTQVANLYCKNPFHNFSHASYVVMAVTKYMNRIIAASDVDVGFDAGRERSSTHEAMHDHTYGITSDPLTQFACVFSALIHDIDHPGVPNTQLIKENERLAAVYKNRSVAEQRSFDLAWDLLTEPTFDTLRGTLCAGENELRRFRQLVINSVMATDLGDKELKELRNARWSKAFDESADNFSNTQMGVHRKATIVIEHLIQAADVAHTCQHWNIYRKWNERLFEECYEAYRRGRAEKNPVEYWYEGEIGFFDFYIIPLSKKLRDCGVFGPTSDENLNYAQDNRAMWVKNGQAIVAEMYERVTAGEAVKTDQGGASLPQSQGTLDVENDDVV